MTTVVISQPMYFPWAGFLAQMALADVFIWLDDAQFSKGSFTNRVQVKTTAGPKWMTVPLAGKGSFTPIRDLQAVGDDWPATHRALLVQALQGQPQCQVATGLFDRVMRAGGTLCDRLIAGAEAQAQHLGVLPNTILRASALQQAGASWDRVLRLVQAVGGTQYLTGHGALAYLDHAAFNAQGIAVSYMDYAPRPWPQAHGPFTPFVTGLDLIASLPAEQGKTHLCPATLDWRAFKARKEHAS